MDDAEYQKLALQEEYDDAERWRNRLIEDITNGNFQSLSAAEQKLMQAQKDILKRYLLLLQQRIALLDTSEQEPDTL